MRWGSGGLWRLTSRGCVPAARPHAQSEGDASREEQEAEEYEAGLPYLRGMPEAFVRCADVTLAIGGRELRVHSQLLAAKSAFFASMWADIGDFEGADMPERAAGRVPGTTLEQAMEGRCLRDVLLFLDAVYRGVSPQSLADARAMALLADESECPELLRSCDAVLASAAGFAAARLEALTGEPGTSSPDPEAFGEWAIFAKRTLPLFQSKMGAVLIDDWDIARQAKSLQRLSPEVLLRIANGHDFRRRFAHRPPSKLLKKRRRTGDLTADQ